MFEYTDGSFFSAGKALSSNSLFASAFSSLCYFFEVLLPSTAGNIRAKNVIRVTSLIWYFHIVCRYLFYFILFFFFVARKKEVKKPSHISSLLNSLANFFMRWNCRHNSRRTRRINAEGNFFAKAHKILVYYIKLNNYFEILYTLEKNRVVSLFLYVHVENDAI